MQDENNQNYSNKEPQPTPDTQKALEEKNFQFPLWGKIALLIAAVSLAIIGYTKSGNLQTTDTPDPEQESTRTVESRQTVPDVTLVDTDGKTSKLSQFKGQVVLVTFWAQWCEPCLVELPTFAHLQNKYESKGFKIVAINVDEADIGKKFATELWKQKNFKYLSFFDETKAAAEQFGVEVLPANFVLDRKGLLAFSSFGANDWSSSDTAEMIENLLAEKP